MINISSYNRLISDACLYLYSCILFLSIILASNLNTPIIHSAFNVLMISVIGINFLFLIIKHHLRNIIFPIIIIILFLIFLLFKIKIVSLNLILLYLMYYNSDFINLKSFIKCNLLTTLISFIVIVILNLFGIIPSVISTLPGADKGYTFGFTHPDGAGAMVVAIISSLFICASYLVINNYQYKGQILSATIFISIILMLIFYPLTKCRQLLYFEIIVVFLILLYKYRNLVYILILPLTVLIPSLSVYLDYKYDPIKDYVLNNLLSGRLNMQHIVLEEYPVHFVQHSYNIPDLNNLSMMKGTVLIDNSYISILELFGIIGIIISACILLQILISAIKFKEYIPYILVISLIICSIVQSSLFAIYLDGPLLYCGILLNYKIKMSSENYYKLR